MAMSPRQAEGIRRALALLNAQTMDIEGTTEQLAVTLWREESDEADEALSALTIGLMNIGAKLAYELAAARGVEVSVVMGELGRWISRSEVEGTGPER